MQRLTVRRSTFGGELIAAIREMVGGWLWLAWLRVTTPEQFNSFVAQVEGKRMPPPKRYAKSI